MPTLAEPGFTQAAFDAFLHSRDEPDWLLDMRSAAWRRFCEMDWPARNEEEWRRTDIRLFKLGAFHLPSDPAGEPQFQPGLLHEGVQVGGQLCAVDSRTTDSQLADRWAKKGVIFGPLGKMAREHGDLVRRHLFHVVDPEYDRFAALHAACWSGGQLLYVPRNVTLDEPLYVHSLIGEGGADFGHTLVILEEGAEATLLTEMSSQAPAAPGLHCGATELILGPRSRLRYVGLQNWGSGVWHFAHQRALLHQDASLQWTLGALGGRLAKVNQAVSLIGAGAESQVNGVMFTEGKQHLSYHTLQHHEAPSCRSDFLYKTALQDRSHTVWRGMIRVDRGAQKTDGYQRNDNLILSEHARADSIPGLEIEADDVRCTHGSTSGRVDEELIFYARCRGFTRNEAIRAIVIGFFQQVFDRVTIESVRDALSQAIAQRVREYK
ncbi:MAG: Fe-S cluster assembly protein SufD [Planctomycetes bacterium]|nr:Fe-S cluster assembly protein SufD [Planctomycetota bacterium]